MCAPDLGSVGAGRRCSTGCSGDLQRLAVAGILSRWSSGAPRSVKQKLCSSSEELKFLGPQIAAGGGGLCLLLVRWSGSFRWTAGGLAKGSGRLAEGFGAYGVGLKMGRFSGPRGRQVFVVDGSACGEGEG